MTFETSLARVLAHEGGYVCNPADPGGATCWGITEQVARDHGYKGPMEQLPQATAAIIYRGSYWSPIWGDRLPPPLAFQVFDAAVNNGLRQAVRWAQSAAVLPIADQDGVMGPRTLGAIQAFSVQAVTLRFIAQRLEFYTGLGTWGSFGRGWTRRMAENIQYAAQDLEVSS